MNLQFWTMLGGALAGIAWLLCGFWLIDRGLRSFWRKRRHASVQAYIAAELQGGRR